MTETSREALLSAAFVKLADTFIDDFDVVDPLQTLVEECVRIFDTEAAGLMLANADGALELVASTSEEAKLVEIMQLSAGGGPCIECYRSASRSRSPISTAWAASSRSFAQRPSCRVSARYLRHR